VITLVPHKATPVFHTLLEPKVLVSPAIAEDLSQISRHVSSEVGFMGLVERELKYSDEKILVADYYRITEIFLLEQECHSGTTELSADAMAALGRELMGRGNDDYDKLRFWGHTHPFGSVSPSSQDEAQMTIFRRNGCPWFLRGIFAPTHCEYTIFNYELNGVWRNVPWEVDYPTEDRAEYWKQQLAEKVKRIEYGGFNQGKKTKGGKASSKSATDNAATQATRSWLWGGDNYAGLD